jgi:integrase
VVSPSRPPHQARGGHEPPGQLQIFLQAAGDHRLFAFYHLAAYTGARRGELLNLRWEHVDLDRAQVRIAGSAAVIGGQRVEGTTKGGRSRMVSIDPARSRCSGSDTQQEPADTGQHRDPPCSRCRRAPNEIHAARTWTQCSR